VVSSHSEAKQWGSPSAAAPRTERREAPAFGPSEAEQQGLERAAAWGPAALAEPAVSGQPWLRVKAAPAEPKAEQQELGPAAALQAQALVAPWVLPPLRPVSFRL
jgi:hypothetical protein